MGFNPTASQFAFPGFGNGTTNFMGAFNTPGAESAPLAGSVPLIGAPDNYGTVPGVNAPAVGGVPNAPAAFGKLGFNTTTFGLGLSGLNAIGSIYGALKSAALANKQFRFSSALASANLGNQIKTYNTTLEDRANNRQFVQGDKAGSADAYLASHKLVMPKLG